MSARFGRTGRARLSAACAVLAVVATAAGCSGDDGDEPKAGASGVPVAKGDGPAAEVKLPDGCITTYDAETPAQISAAVSQALFVKSPVVVVAPATDSPELTAGVDAAKAAGAPLLVTDTSAEGAPSVDASPTSSASPSAAPTSASQSAVSFDADTADCATPPAAATPSSSPTSTPTSTSEPSAEPTSTGSVNESDEGDEESTAEPTETASPDITPAAFTVSTEVSGESSCIESNGGTPSASEPSSEPSATAEPSDEPSTGATASPTATATEDTDASPSPTSTETPSSGPVNVPLDPTVAAEIQRLAPQAVLATSPAVAQSLRDALPGVKVVENAADLPKTSVPAPLSGLAVLLPNDNEDVIPGALAAAATAASAGASPVGVHDGDPRSGSCAVQALFKAKPTRVLGVGDMGDADRLSYRMGVVGTGEELPGGGQLFFPGRRLVALYGYPGAPELGVLGAQGVDASIERAKNVAELYEDISDVPVIPTFEVIATVAQGAAGSDGNYSAESTIEQLKPWVEKADAAGMYVILDLQSGRSNFLTQAKRYAELLKNPHVGLALDPEWRLFGGQLPLRQIGHVDSSEINEVIDWLADFTVENNLPQKLLVLHQFSLSMITNRSAIDTSHDSLSILVHMDGQGQPIQKEGTWRIVTNTMPKEIWMGWKNFYKKDTRLMSPTETLNRTPVPVMISYQ